MSSWRGFLSVVLATIGLGLALSPSAAELKQGKDYRVINPPVLVETSRIEVTEFFWYGCPHCFDFEPVLTEWVKKLPADVVFRRVPAVFPNNKWTPGARLYYTLEALNLVDTLHAQVFAAIHGERQRLDDSKVLLDWVSKRGVDANKFSEAWSSFGVQTRVQQAGKMTEAAALTGVPSVMVHGRYLALTQGNYDDLLATVEQLVARVRVEAIHK